MKTCIKLVVYVLVAFVCLIVSWSSAIIGVSLATLFALIEQLAGFLSESAEKVFKPVTFSAVNLVKEFGDWIFEEELREAIEFE